MSKSISTLIIGTFSALPLLIGAWVALKLRIASRLVGLIAAFGAGALISAIAFELVLDAVERSAPFIHGLALATGAVVYFAGSEYLERRSKSGNTGSRGLALLMGATLDGIPESIILGMSIAAGAGVSIPFLLAVVVSNLPEGMASAAELGGKPGFSNRRILGMWCIVVGVSALATMAGARLSALGGVTGEGFKLFAAGALLTMLTDDLIPEAREKGGLGAGLAAVLGFAVAFALHQYGS